MHCVSRHEGGGRGGPGPSLQQQRVQYITRSKCSSPFSNKWLTETVPARGVKVKIHHSWRRTASRASLHLTNPTSIMIDDPETRALRVCVSVCLCECVRERELIFLHLRREFSTLGLIHPPVEWKSGRFPNYEQLWLRHTGRTHAPKYAVNLATMIGSSDMTHESHMTA